MSEILQELQIKINTDEACYINVRRSAIWSDTCRQLMRKRFSTLHRVSVKFADNEGKSEGAIDVGGPKREFFRLLVKAVNEDSGIFIGPEGCRSLYPNSIGMYFIIAWNECIKDMIIAVVIEIKAIVN